MILTGNSIWIWLVVEWVIRGRWEAARVRVREEQAEKARSDD